MALSRENPPRGHGGDVLSARPWPSSSVNPCFVTTLYLIRHAQAHPLPDQPEPDWALSAGGEAQARGLVPVLQRLGIGRLYTSPYRRCRDTLAPFAAASGIACLAHDGLRERRIVPAWQRDFREVWRRSWEDFAYAFPGGEDSWTCRTRITAAVTEIAARHPGETLALGSHGNAIGLLLHSFDGSFGETDASALRTPEIMRIEERDDRLVWDRAFRAGDDFDRLATDFRQTPNVVA
jgi:2,3-bisphosphoglycerate-dependent phosphoglycerate mutase